MRFYEFNVTLNEVSMAPGKLTKLAGSIKAICGIEFEMYVPTDITSDEEIGISERCLDLQDMFDFFDEHNYTYPDDAPSKIADEYEEFFIDTLGRRWQDEEDTIVEDYITEHFDYDSFYESQFEDMNLDDEELEAAMEAVRSKDFNNDHFSTAYDNLEDHINFETRDAIRRQTRDYEYAKDEWLNDSSNHPDQSDFLKSIGIRTYSDALEHLDLSHKYSLNTHSLAEQFEYETGFPAEGSDDYHGNQESKGNVYVVELDSSLDDDTPADYSGVEIVSPRLPLEEVEHHLDQVYSWCNKNNCVTSEATGLHINVSLPDVDMMNQLDYIKLIMFLGDKHILDKFDRASSTYCKSAMNTIKEKSYKNQDVAFDTLNKLKQSLSSLAQHEVQGFRASIKYTSVNALNLSSVNPENSRIEFRSPGGDWLNINKKEIMDTINRFVVAMDIACDPNKHQQEYAKKLYKLIDPKSIAGNVDPVMAHSLRAAGFLPDTDSNVFPHSIKASKKGQPAVRASQWLVSYSNTQPITVNAVSELSAINAYRSHYNMNRIQHPDNQFTVRPATQTDLFGYKDSPRVPQKQPEPQAKQNDPLDWVVQRRVPSNIEEPGDDFVEM